MYKIIEANAKRKNPRVKNGFGVLWLGCIIDHLGFDWEKYRCRGEILDYNLDGNVLTIYQDTAWCEQEGFRECIEKKYPSIKVYYRDEEPGCGVYYTNDSTGKYFPDLISELRTDRRSGNTDSTADNALDHTNQSHFSIPP